MWDANRAWSWGLVVVATCAAAACAMPVRQLPISTPLVAASGRTFLLIQDAHCAIGTGYSRVLRGGTHWHLFGSIDRGDVYRSSDQVLTVEGYNVHEAYIVVQGDSLVGFYLPVEKTFTPASNTVKLITTFQQEETQ